MLHADGFDYTPPVTSACGGLVVNEPPTSHPPIGSKWQTPRETTLVAMSIDVMQGPILQTFPLPRQQVVGPCVSTNPTPDLVAGFLCRLFLLSFVLRPVLSNSQVY